MRSILLGIPAQFAKGIQSAMNIKIAHDFTRIISCGMGGSAIAGEVLSMVRNDVVNHWDYDLPVNANKNDLVICTSWSGDTEETISSYQKAVDSGIPVLVITGGGKLEQLAQKNGSPLIVLPKDKIAPRAATGYMAGALFAALGLQDMLPESFDSAALEEQGKDMAMRFGKRIPVIYTSYPWRKVSGFWKMAFSETTKQHVFTNWFPSGAHNEIVGWAGPYRDLMNPVIMRDKKEDVRYTKNFDALLATFSKIGYNVVTIEFSGNTLLEKVFNSYLLALWTAFAVAQQIGVDPQKTELLDEFKRLKAK